MNMKEKPITGSSRRFWSIAALTALLVLPGLGHAGEPREVVTGLDFDPESGQLEAGGEPARLFGLSFPREPDSCEEGETCEDLARKALGEWVEEPDLVECVVLGTSYTENRMVRCRYEGQDLSGWLICQGLAVSQRSLTRDYVRDEQAARDAGRGLWSASTRPSGRDAVGLQ